MIIIVMLLVMITNSENIVLAFTKPSMFKNTDIHKMKSIKFNHRKETSKRCLFTSSYLQLSSGSDSSSQPGDKLREATGKRPSLNPTIINAISEALLIRCSKLESMPMEVFSSDIQPINIALAASKIATDAIDKRAKSSSAVKGDESSAFTQTECQLIAGRIVGVVMRFRDLESLLVKKVKNVPWVKKYGEEGSFGLTNVEVSDSSVWDEIKLDVYQKIKDDPLLRMGRAECLYALFLRTVEFPTLEKLGESVDGSSAVDFLDSEKMEVLFPLE